MMTHKLKNMVNGWGSAWLTNIALVYAAYAVCRLVYVAENWGTLSAGFGELDWGRVARGCWMFDSSAIAYTNALYLLMVLLPLRWRETGGWQKAARGVFVAVNAVAVALNLADAAYFPYTGRRTGCTVVNEFSNEGNLLTVMGAEVLRHWYLLIIGGVMIYGLWRLYRTPRPSAPRCGGRKLVLWTAGQTLVLGVVAALLVCAMRGGATTAVRPITLSNANQYVNRPSEAAMVLNTPFALIRTAGKKAFVNPGYFSREELDDIYSPVHRPQWGEPMRRMNVVVIIVESFGREYVGALNGLKDGGYTPFTDSLIQHSLTFEYSFANGRKSIDGMPSVLSAIPHFGEPFFLTPAALNDVSGLARELGQVGYSSAFFHGAENGSMGFEAFARATGYERYYGRTEYCQDPQTGGDRDFDGTWAIWDEEFLQYMARTMSGMKEPFVTTVFTASSHHPYVVPERYRDRYHDLPGDDNVMHKCIRYTDHALQHFFDTARREGWYDHTLFVITADHTNIASHPEYRTDLGLYSVPIILHDPSGSLPTGRRQCIAQQTDIMPTVLSHLRYPRPYVAFGSDLLTTPDSLTWAVNNNAGIYQYLEGEYLLQFTEGGTVSALYDYRHDPLLQHDLKAQPGTPLPHMVRRLKAIIQQYMMRMEEDRLRERE